MSDDRLEQIKKRTRAAGLDLPMEVKTDTLNGPEVHDAYDEVARIEVSHAVWVCDDEQDGCPEISRRAVARARFIAQAPADIDWLVEEVERLQAEEAVAWQKGYEKGFKDGHKTAKGEK